MNDTTRSLIQRLNDALYCLVMATMYKDHPAESEAALVALEEYGDYITAMKIEPPMELIKQLNAALKPYSIHRGSNDENYNFNRGISTAIEVVKSMGEEVVPSLKSQGSRIAALQSGSYAEDSPTNQCEISVTELNQLWLDAQRDDLFDVIVPSDVRRLLSEISRLRQLVPVSSQSDLNTCPSCGGIADNGHDRCYPPSPYFCTKCTAKSEQPVELPHPEIDLAMLDYAIWHNTKPDDFMDGEEVFIQMKDTGQCYKAFWSREEWQFYIGDGVLHVSKVNYRKIFPEGVIERAAINQLASLRSPKRESTQPDELCPFCGEDMSVKNGRLICRGNWDGDKCKMNVAIPMRELGTPNEAKCAKARWFILARDANLTKWGDLARVGRDTTTPYIEDKIANDPTGHITKWDVAQCVYELMNIHIEGQP